MIAQTGMVLFLLLFFLPTQSFTCLHAALRQGEKVGLYGLFQTLAALII